MVVYRFLLPLYTDSATLIWLALSGFVGYVFGRLLPFNSYVLIGSLVWTVVYDYGSIAAAFSDGLYWENICHSKPWQAC